MEMDATFPARLGDDGGARDFGIGSSVL